MPIPPLVRQITAEDSASLSSLLTNAEYVHRHLDWRSPIDWIGSHPFLVIERHNQLISSLACPFIQDSVGWVRFFAFADWNFLQLRDSWNQLFLALLDTHFFPPGYLLAGLGLQSWFTDLLVGSGFKLRQHIVVLQWLDQTVEPSHMPCEIRLRLMQQSDLEWVLTVDNQAFEQIWQHTRDELRIAFQQAAYATVAEMDHEIVGYQISTSTPFHAHLARLAVDPGMQRLSIGYGLVQDMLSHFKESGISNITVNTQSDNYSSLALYKKIGFYRTGDEFPVYTFPIG